MQTPPPRPLPQRIRHTYLLAETPSRKKQLLDASSAICYAADTHTPYLQLYSDLGLPLYSPIFNPPELLHLFSLGAIQVVLQPRSRSLS